MKDLPNLKLKNNKIEKNIGKKENTSILEKKIMDVSPKKKLDKSIVIQIEICIQDMRLNGELNNIDLQNINTSQEIATLIFTIIDSVNNISDKKLDYLEKINSLLKDSIKIHNPIYTNIRLEQLYKQIADLKKIPQPEQRTPEWYKFRENRLTASDLGTVIGVNPYQNLKSVLSKKVGIETPFYTNQAMLHGIKFEDVAIKIYEYRNKVNVYEYGCIPHPEIECFGASPDGICDYNSENQNFVGRMLEIKCPSKRPITGFIPEYYLAQVQGQLEVCDLEYCDFLECRLTEYMSKEDYYSDLCDYKDINTYRKNGLEKGVLIEAYDIKKSKATFFYCPLGYCKEQIDKWESDIIDKILEDNNMEYQKTTYWKLDFYNELLIKRDIDWWNNIASPQIYNFWELVKEHRKKPIEELDNLFRKSKKKKTIINEKDKIENYISVKTKLSPSSKTELFLSDSD